MKRIFCVILALVLMTGCSTDSVYRNEESDGKITTESIEKQKETERMYGGAGMEKLKKMAKTLDTVAKILMYGNYQTRFCVFNNLFPFLHIPFFKALTQSIV